MAIKNLKRQKENIYKEKRRAIINKSSNFKLLFEVT